MKYGLGTTIASASFLFIIISVYMTKKMKQDLENRIFKYILITCSMLCISTLAYGYFLREFNIKYLNIITWRLYVFSIVIFIQLLITYIIVLTKKYKNQTLRDLFQKDILFRIVTIFFIILQLTLLFIPHFNKFELFDRNNIVYTTPVMSMISLLLTLVSTTLTIVLVNNNKENLDKETKRNCYIIAFSTLIGIIQLLLPETSLYSFSATIITIIVYLIFSNPDLKKSKELAKEKENIKNNSKTKMKFLSNVTLEMKTPVDYITSLSKDLEKAENYDINEIKKTMQQIISSGNSLLDIVNNVLNITNIESGQMSVTNQNYKIREMIHDVVNVAKSKIAGKPVTIDVIISETLSHEYQGDAIKIQQALLNVLTNAAKYTEVGKIIFEINNTKVAFGEKILFKIIDTGIGIKEEDKSKIFKKSRKTEKTFENESESSGYGLAITKEYLELIDGKIWFESEFGAGTTFFIEIVQKPVSKAKEIKEKTEDIITEKLDCTGKIALVLDDNKLNVKVVKRLLEKYGFKVVTSSSGQDCINRVKKEEEFDIIFMDQVMEGMSGLETMRVLRGLDGYDIPPIILLTANAVAGMKEQYIKEGFDDYVPKPITTFVLEQLLKKYIKKTQ